jgi:hypothetical protein
MRGIGVVRAGNRLRRGKEIYPPFDTRRVLWKQQRTYCVNRLRAGTKLSNASSVASGFCKNGQGNIVQNALPPKGENGADCLVAPAGQSTQKRKGLNVAFIKLPTMKESDKSSRNGTGHITSLSSIIARAAYVARHLSHTIHTPAYAQRGVSGRINQACREAITAERPTKEESKRGNTGSARPTTSKSIRSASDCCLTFAS